MVSQLQTPCHQMSKMKMLEDILFTLSCSSRQLTPLHPPTCIYRRVFLIPTSQSAITITADGTCEHCLLNTGLLNTQRALCSCRSGILRNKDPSSPFAIVSHFSPLCYVGVFLFARNGGDHLCHRVQRTCGSGVGTQFRFRVHLWPFEV